MDTNKLKRFAGEARVKLKAGVANMLQLYGFDANGNASTMPERITGGAIFNGTTITDETFYDKWMSLYNAIQAHGVKEVYEEVAYTWFNRFMAIRIMRKNGFINPILEYSNPELRIPSIVADARRGNIPPMQEVDRRRLQDLLLDDSKTSEQFAILIVAYCQNNPVIKSCFGKINDYTEFLLPKTILAPGDFVDMINNTPFITDDDYKHSELIGWLYQFYISEKKDEVFAAFKDGKKAAAEDIPAATQIFTPNWIVKYMVQNTLGRIYLDNFENDDLKDQWKYLVPPAKGESAKLKVEELEDLTLIDPGCGSGHILSEAFEMLYEMYRADFASPREACTSILTRNLTGIDLDTRAKQLSQFSILMKACQKDDSFLSAAVMPRIYDMPEPYRSSVPLRDTLPHFFLGGDKKTIDETVKAIELMDQAKNLGSIMKFDISEKTRYQIKKRLEEVRSQGQMNSTFAQLAPYFDVILALTDKYACVVANPPYMGASNMNSSLKNYIERNYPKGKSDLMTVFMEMASIAVEDNGYWAMINLPSWLFLPSFQELREDIISNQHIASLLQLGRGIFGSDFGSVSFVLQKAKTNQLGYYRRLFEVQGQVRPIETIDALYRDPNFGVYWKNQTAFQSIPGSPLAFWVSDTLINRFDSLDKVRDHAEAKKGLSTGDNNRFLRLWHEVSRSKEIFDAAAADNEHRWFPINKGGNFRKWYGNNEYVINWEQGGKEIKAYSGSVIRNEPYYFKESLTWTMLSASCFGIRYSKAGKIFEGAGPSLFATNEQELWYILGFLCSKLGDMCIRILNPTINININDVLNLPLFRPVDNEVISHTKECISLSQSDWDAHETSWDFKKNDLLRLLIEEQDLGHQNSWYLDTLIEYYKSEWENRFEQLHDNEEELNRQFIEIYGLQDELTPDVPLNEVTILQQGEISIEDNQVVWHEDVIIKQLISYIIGCYMGRYRLDREGLAIAHPNPSAEETAAYNFTNVFGTEHLFEIDKDGLIPALPSDSGFADNALLAVRQFIQKVFGEDSYAANLNYIENCLSKPLEEYLFKDFWNDHKKMYQNRPIYWLFSSKKGAFKVLAYCHRMTRHTAELVRQKYLLPYIDRMKGRADEIQAKGASATAAERRQLKNLTAAIAECEEYHTRLHAIADQQITFDLDDGVIRNYALFGDVLSKIK